MRFFYTRSTTRQIVARTSRIFGFCAALAALGAAPGPLAWAGPNAGGVLLFHAAEQIAYCQDTQSYCGLSGQPGCEEVDARVNGQTTRVWFALAAFPDGASPRVKALSFGVEYESSGVTLVAQGSCADFEITTSQWPNSGEGTAITWNTAKTSAVTEAYWFAGYNYYAPDPTTFALRSHPTQGGNFADDSVPALLDPIADYGRLGFDQEGYVPCSVPPPQTGACCAADGSCSVLSASGCAQAGGVYQGDETVCEPNPCPPAGACCAADTGCQVLTSELCALAGGIWQGAGSGCDPNPCLDIPAACCLSSGACVVLSATDCASAGGVYQGIGSECGAGACPPGGACCADDGSCVVKLASDCFDAYQGDGSSCDPNPCAQPCPGVAEGGGESELPEVYPSSNLFGRRGDGGANQGGVLLMHSNPSLTYTDGAGPFCGDSGLDDCALANNRHDGSDARVIHVLAAFPLRSFPRLIGLTFGLRRTDCAVIEAWGSCGDFEIATDGWPGNNQGTAVAWDEAQTGLMTEVYWFAAYAYDGREATLGLRTHPTQGLYFADDQVPAILDPVVAVSGFGFNISNGDPVCPAPLPPAGACCLPSGDCAFLTPAACSTSGGAYQGDDVACQPDLCPPGGACCAPEGNCTILTSDACALAEGIWIGGESVCDPNPCLALEGACCLPSGGCEIRSVADCHAQGGVFQGIGSDCSEVICPPVGACCFVDGHCVLSFGPDCLGVYQGDGTACDPNPCPQPCPGFSGGGSEARGSETMPPIAGAQRGNGGPNEGGVLIMHSNPDLTFTDGGGSYCGQSQLTDCEEAINRYDGQDSRIIHVLAAFPFRSHPRMAGVTFGLRRTECAVIESWGHCGDNEATTSGWPNNHEGTAVTWFTPQTAPINEVYWFAAYAYDARVATMGIRVHPTQGLYFADDSIPAILDPVAAVSGFGFYLDDGPVVCPEPLPARGACCLNTGECQVLLPAECLGLAGRYQGDDTICTPDLCPPAGACCLDNTACFVGISEYCEFLGGLWLGEDTFCDPNPCVEIPAACCLQSGLCELLSMTDCTAQDGDFRGIGSDCATAECPAAGACCYPDGSCTVGLPWNCGGNYQGDDTLCDPNPCPQPCNLEPVVHWENRPDPKPTFVWPGRGPAGDGTGPNRSGVLILHGDPAVTYTDGGGDYCGQSSLTVCEDAITRHDGAEPIVIYTLAAFAPGTSPRMAGLTFGITYGSCVVLDDWGACADFELPTAQWPEPNEGTALYWSETQTGELTEVYWFAAYSYEGRVDELQLIGHPTQGATFADDSVPAVTDPVRALGRFGFTRNGQAICPSNLPADGACCLLTGDCVVVSAATCAGQEGTYAGNWTDCPVSPCEPRGACCVVTACSIRTAGDCASNGGIFQGVGVGCSPNPCPTGGGCRPGTVSGTRGDEPASVGFGTGTLLPDTRGTGCGTLNLNPDGSYENGYTWGYGGVQLPYYGAFAECYSAVGSVCSVVLDLTQIGQFSGQSLDAYIWDNDGGCPGHVLGVAIGYVPTGIAFWPSISRHVVDIGVAVGGNFWAGYWPNWPGGSETFYVAADLDGFGGCPYTNIAPGIGYPSGWQNVSVVWGPTQALGIGVEIGDGPTATRKMSWGRVKALYGK